MSVALQAAGLGKTYGARGSEQAVLRGVNLLVEQGEFVAVMGPSGSGKSTLLYSLSGMDRPTAGQVRLNNQEITGLSEPELANLRLNQMGFVFQQSHLLRNLTIRDNIALPGYRAKKADRKTIRQRADELMQKTGIAELADHDITQASGGQLQRATICRALINQPEIVFGDEPTGALNSQAAAEVMDILTELNQAGTTILLVTHDAKVAARTERIIFMLDGSIVSELTLGKPGEDAASSKQREQRVSAWLLEQGF